MKQYTNREFEPKTKRRKCFKMFQNVLLTVHDGVHDDHGVHAIHEGCVVHDKCPSDHDEDEFAMFCNENLDLRPQRSRQSQFQK